MISTLAAVHFQSGDFGNRLASALDVIGRALKAARKPYVAFSGGKDSVALLGLVEWLEPNVPVVWSDDELEFPELVEYMIDAQRVAGSQFTVTEGYALHAGWFWPWRDRPYWREPLPGTLRIEMPVDDWMNGAGYDLVFTGLRMEENRRRRDWLAQAGPLYRVNSGVGRRCCPLWDWSADDVWALIAGWRLPYCEAYDVYEQIGVPRKLQRVGPLPLSRRAHLADGWPATLERLEARYGRRWQ